MPLFRREIYVQQQKGAPTASARAEVDDALERLSTDQSR